MSQDNQFDKKSQGWSALFSEPMSALVQRYTASVGFDRRLWRADLQGSLAHAEMLAAQGLLSAEDHAAIVRGMAQIAADIEAGRFEWKLELEDVHLNIEARLTQLVGDAGKRLHTGRSRNDQVALDIRLYLRGAIDAIVAALADVQRALVAQAARHTATVMPGFTHLQVAQPVTFGHHLLAYVEMFERDLVVARPTGVQPLAGIADEFGQALLDVQVHVLQRQLPGELAALDLAADLCHAALDRREIVGRQDADLGQHGGMRQRSLDVDERQPLVEAHARGVAQHEVRHRFGEPSGPGLVLGVQRRGRRCHNGCGKRANAARSWMSPTSVRARQAEMQTEMRASQ